MADNTSYMVDQDSFAPSVPESAPIAPDQQAFAPNPEEAVQLQRTRSAIDTAAAAPAEGEKKIHTAGGGTRRAIKTLEASGNAAVENQKRYEDQYVKPGLAKQAELQKQYDEAVQTRTEYRAKVMSEMDNMDTMAKQLASEQVHDRFAEAPTWMKVISIAAMSLGAAAQAAYGDRTNAVTDQIDGAIKRDLMFQRMRLEKGQDDFKNKNLLLRQFMDSSEHMQGAEDKAYLTAINGITQRMEMSKSLLTSPTMRANMDKQIAELKMKAAESQQRVTENIVGQDIRQKDATAQLEAQLLKTMETNKSAKATASQLGTLGTVQGVDFPEGFQGDPKKEGAPLRDLQAGTASVSGVMDKLKASFKNFDSISSLAHPVDKFSAYQQLQQEVAALILKTKGKQFGNMGARLTEMQKALDAQAFGASTKGVLNVDNALKIVDNAKEQIWQDFSDAAEARGGRVQPDFLKKFGLESVE